MSEPLIDRHLRFQTDEILDDTPVLVLQGARQVGKSTLARSAAASRRRNERDDSQYVTLDDEQTLAYVRHDPAAFLDRYRYDLLVIDEVQREPRLMLAIKAAVDENRQPGRFLLTGSADLLRVPGIGDSLAGRAESLVLRPFSVGEIEERSVPEDFVTTLINQRIPDDVGEADLTSVVLRGGYPEPFRRSPRRAERWYDSYIERLAQHDAAEISTGSFSRRLHSLLRLVAAQGQAELVVAKLARQIGAAENTVRGYLDLCAAMYLLDDLPSWGAGFRGRETRRPKVSLVDTGLAAGLTGFTAEQAVAPGGFEYFGALVEQFVVSELRKQQAWSATRFRLYHYRNRGEEVDVVVELADGSLILVEVKSSTTVTATAWRTLERLKDQWGDRVRAGVVFHAGQRSFTMHDWLHVLPISALWRT